LTAARLEKGLTQAALADRCRLTKQHISYFEQGQRLPSLDQLLRLARALEVPLQRFLSGSNRPGTELSDIALELRALGLLDLWVDGSRVPGAFRCPEEITALSVAGAAPEARVVEGLPTILAWNRWSGSLLRAYGRTTRPRTVYRLAWLAEVALAVDRRGGFPGGCPGKDDLAAFVKGVKAPPPGRWDSLGRAALEPSASPLWKRWRISYAADLDTFRARAEALEHLRRAEGRRPLVAGR
jgi:transcriptional regulator with XRE-family HTH domain